MCADTGLLPNFTCPVRREVFVEGTQPRAYHLELHWQPPGPEEEGPETPTGDLPEDGRELLDWLFGR